jgi:hypothetical protein
VRAHELGHNFGAPHDGESGGACATAGSGHIMWPTVGGHSTFSSCSVGIMRSVLDSASCVVPAEYADVSVTPAESNLWVDGGVSFLLPWTVRASGTSATEDVAFQVTLSEGLGQSIDSISAEQGSCSVSGASASCRFGSLSPGETRSVTLTVRVMKPGNLSARGQVSAANDRLASNNTRDVTISVRSGVDAAVTLAAAATEVALGAPLQLDADIRSLRALAVRDAVVTLNLNQPVTSASLPGASCVINTRSVVCNLAELPAGEARRLTVVSTVNSPGPLYATVNVSATGDGDLSNNNASAQGWVQAERDLDITVGPAAVDLAVGERYEVPLLVRSRGSQALAGVSLLIAIPPGDLE